MFHFYSDNALESSTAEEILPMMHKSKPLVAKVNKTSYANEVSLTDQPNKFLKHMWTKSSYNTLNLLFITLRH